MRSTTRRITVRKSTVGGTAIGAPCIRARGISARGIGTGRGAAVGISCVRGSGGGTDSRAGDVGMVVRSAIRGGAIRGFVIDGVVSAGVVNGSGTGMSRKCSNEGKSCRGAESARMLWRIRSDDRHVLTGKCALGRPKGRAGDELIPPVAITIIVRVREGHRIAIEQIHHTSPSNSNACINSSTPTRRRHARASHLLELQVRSLFGAITDISLVRIAT
ncbi:hypothetical protein [Microbispora sp. H10885]|uniref:hypothetical protein n=1 Tax=Microbispora sp. H10885 TaxID=2729110 RepID=UPI001603F8A9|nr:hypothetical protein [Microbispora sp. H10885]